MACCDIATEQQYLICLECQDESGFIKNCQQKEEHNGATEDNTQNIYMRRDLRVLRGFGRVHHDEDSRSEKGSWRILWALLRYVSNVH